MFNLWEKQIKDNYKLVRIYVSGTEKAYFDICRKSKLVKLNCSDELDKVFIEKKLSELGIVANKYSNIYELHNDLESRSFVETKKPHNKNVSFPVRDFYSESLNLDCAKTPFKASSVKKIKVTVDHREPEELLNELSKSKLNVESGHLEHGDVLIEHEDFPNRSLLIERKRVDDLRQSIVGEERRAHKQAEAYYELQQKASENDGEMRVIWICEGQEGRTSYHDSLESLQQVIGWTSYMVAINQFQMLESYSTTMTAYQILKFAQGFFEMELPNPVKIGSTRIDKRGVERNKITKRLAYKENRDHGVVNSGNSLAALLGNLPHSNTKIGTSLAETGKSFSEIAAMNVEQLMEVDGIGAVKAKQLFDVFNRTN